MYHPLELYIGLRYTRSKRRSNFISFISATSMMGIFLGVTALITVLSVMNGFEKELRERILGMASHATVSELHGRLSQWPLLSHELSGQPHVLGVAPYIQVEAMLTNGRLVSGALTRGVQPELESSVSDVAEHMKKGDFDALKSGEYGIIVGAELARALGVGINDKVTVITPQAGVTPAGILPRLRRFTVVGIFEVGMYEYDRATAFMHIQDAARLYDMGDEVTGLRLKLDDMFRAPEIAHELESKLGPEYWLSNWTRQHANFFKAVKTEKRVMFIILLLIVSVAAFNIVATMVMVVNDKQSDIAILRTLGLSPGRIMAIFIIQGSVIGLLGTILGVTGGVLLALNVETIVPAVESMFQTKFLPPDVYYISDLPSDLHVEDVIRIALVAFLLSVLATLYPAWRAARTQPAEALRYE